MASHSPAHLPARILLLALMTCPLVFAGCGQPRKTPGVAPDSMGASVSPSPESGLVVVSRQAPPRRYYRDTGGQLYYVDARGALHTVVRSETVTETGGGLYYYEEDVPYVLDDRGVLTVRDSQGRVYLLEESGPGQPVDPLPILRGTDTERRLIQGQRHVPCPDRFKDCLSGCAGLSAERDRRECYDNCERVRDRCERGY